MDSIKTRLALLTTNRGLCYLLISAVAGFIVIHVIAYLILAGFDVSKPIPKAFHDIYANRFSSLASGWVITTFTFWWKFVGSHLRKIDRAIAKY